VVGLDTIYACVTMFAIVVNRIVSSILVEARHPSVI
jgi:hypothetical protein